VSASDWLKLPAGTSTVRLLPPRLQGTGDAAGLVALERCPFPGMLAALKRAGFKVFKQKGGLNGPSRCFVEPWAATLCDEVQRALKPQPATLVTRAAIKLASDDPDFRAALLTVSALGDRAALVAFVEAHVPEWRARPPEEPEPKKLLLGPHQHTPSPSQAKACPGCFLELLATGADENTPRRPSGP